MPIGHGSLPLVEPSRALPTVFVPVFCLSRFHLPASLCSTGITPLLRSYEGSVTFRGTVLRTALGHERRSFPRIVIPDSCRSNFLPFYHHPPYALLLQRSLSRRRRGRRSCLALHGSASGSRLRSALRRLANASGRIVFNIVLFMDWQFVSGCLPPRPSTTQFPSTTDSQCSVRWGLPPHCWCALSGARRDALPRVRRGSSKERSFGGSVGRRLDAWRKPAR